MRQTVWKDGVTLEVGPTPTELAHLKMQDERSGVSVQVENLDALQSVDVWPEVRLGADAPWKREEFTDQLIGIQPTSDPENASKKTVWRFPGVAEVRLLAQASGAGVDVKLWGRILYGVQPT